MPAHGMIYGGPVPRVTIEKINSKSYPDRRNLNKVMITTRRYRATVAMYLMDEHAERMAAEVAEDLGIPVVREADYE